MDFNNPMYFEEDGASIRKTKKMNNAISYLETNSHFEYGDDTNEVVDITDAHAAVYMGMIEALTEAKTIMSLTNADTILLDQLINKYKKKI